MVGNALRGGAGILFFVATLLTGLTIAQIVLGPIEAAGAHMRKAGANVDQATMVRQWTDLAKPAITWALGGSAPIEQESGPSPDPHHQQAERWATYLLDE